MKRLLTFPLALGFCGALCAALLWLEGYAAQWVSLTSTDVYWHPGAIASALSSAMQRAAALGFGAGLIFARWDFVRNQNLSTTRNLLPNLFWCLFYATLINAINCLISNIAQGLSQSSSRYPSQNPVTVTTVIIWSISLLHVTAIIWAAIRSITTDDVLTPRVLLGKLRERARLT